MTSTGDDNARLAVLIDADNADPGIVQGLLAEISTFGVASVKRIYGDWTTPQLGRWKPALTACDQFIYTEIFKETGDAPSAPPSGKPGAELRADTRLVSQLRAAVAAGSGENGQAPLGAVGNILLKQSPDFDPRLYGYAKLSDLFEAVGLFAVDRKPGAVYVSDARRKK